MKVSFSKTNKEYYYIDNDVLKKRSFNFFQVILRNYFNFYQETHLLLVARKFCELDFDTIQSLFPQEEEIKSSITKKYSIDKTNEIFSDLFLKRQIRYATAQIEDRFALALNRLKAQSVSGHFADLDSTAELKKKALIIASYVSPESEPACKIAVRMTSKMNRKPTEEELRNKLYSVALRVQLECFLNSVEGPLPATWPGSKFNRQAPHIKLFGEQLKVVSIFNKSVNLKVKGQPDKIALIYNPLKINGSYNTAQEVIFVNGGGEFIARELKATNVAEVDNWIQNVAWKREIEVHKKLLELNIPGIVGLNAVYTSEVGEGIHGLILEKCDGDLTALIGTISDSEQIVVMKQVLTTLIEMHRNNIVHDDIKPANIFFKRVGNELEIKIGDFGFSNECGHIVDQRSGTPIYKPWDGFMAKSPIGPNMDAWAAGLTAYHLRYSKNKKEEFFNSDENQFGLNAQYLNIITKIHNLNKDLKSIAENATNNISLIAAIRKRFNCQEILRSKVLNDMTKALDPPDLLEIKNEIILHYFRPQLEGVLIEVRKSLSNDPYDRMIAGLLQIEPCERMTLEQALATLNDF